MASSKMRKKRQRKKHNKRSNIQNNWNAKIDKTKTVIRLGRNHVLYEYILPLAGDPFHYYEDAIDVRSHKSATTKYNNGKKPGQYQPIGDKSYFTFYQLKNIKKYNKDDLVDLVEVSKCF